MSIYVAGDVSTTQCPGVVLWLCNYRRSIAHCYHPTPPSPPQPHIHSTHAVATGHGTTNMTIADKFAQQDLYVQVFTQCEYKYVQKYFVEIFINMQSKATTRNNNPADVDTVLCKP